MKKLIKNWLFKTELAELKSASAKLSRLSGELDVAKKEINRIKVSNRSEFDGHLRALREIRQVLDPVLAKLDVSVDVHEYSNSWAVVAIQGGKTDYIKFIDLGREHVEEIRRFLTQFEKAASVKIDASPRASGFLRIERF